MNITDLKEIAVDMTAVMIVSAVIYQSVFLIAVSQEMSILAGAAGMYLFGKYTPNSA